MRRMTLAVAATILLTCLAAEPARKAMCAERVPSDGEWTLTYEWSTPPGGFVAGPLVITTSFRATMRFVVNEDGSFSWETLPGGNDQAEYRHEEVGAGKIDTEHLSGFLRGRGAVDKEHALELRLEWGVLQGSRETLTPTHLELARQTVSADSTQITRSGKTYCFTCVHPGWHHSTFTIPVRPTWAPQWRLMPASREVERLGPDVERETVSYRASRQATNMHNERIEVIHVRYGEIVPRAAE